VNRDDRSATGQAIQGGLAFRNHLPFVNLSCIDPKKGQVKMDIYEINRRAAYRLREFDSPNGRTDRESCYDDFITLLDCAHTVFRENPDMMGKLPDDHSDPIIGLRKIEALTRQCYEAKQTEQKKNFLKFIKELDYEKTPPENVQYDYPDHPFIVGYRRRRNEVEWTVQQLNKAFNQQDNFQNPKWAWMGGELSNESISLLEKFVGQPWEADTNKIENIVDLVKLADELETKNRFLGFLKSKLRRYCNIQNPDLLAWEEILAAIKEYMSGQKTAGTNTGQKGARSEPSDECRKAYQLYGVLDRQADVAEQFNKEFKNSHYYPFTQSKVSRLITQYKKWLADNGLPDVNEKPKIKPTIKTVGPDFIEMGARQDGSKATGSQLNKSR
jgi:hypothetical protein